MLGYFLLYRISPSDMSSSSLNVKKFATIPVLHNGRLKPIDSAARNSLTLIQGKQTLKYNGVKISASEWLLTLWSQSEKADAFPVFLINNPEVQMLLGMFDLKKKTVSYNELVPHFETITNQTNTIQKIEDQLRSPFQKEVFSLYQRIMLYHRLKNSFFVEGTHSFYQTVSSFEKNIQEMRSFVKETNHKFEDLTEKQKQILVSIDTTIQQFNYVDQINIVKPLPSLDDPMNDHWNSMGAGITNYLDNYSFHPLINLFAKSLDAVNHNQPELFNKSIERILAYHELRAPRVTRFAKGELLFNEVQFFMKSIILYFCIFLLLCISWLRWPAHLTKAGFYLLLIAFGIHTMGLLFRIILQGRPPVTNLYSSAIFIGWVSVGLGIILERYYKNKIAVFLSAVLGFITLIIAHNLSLSGDTMEMMQAVLDSNFWLSTHVVTVTIGYSSTYVAGFIGLFYVFRGLLSSSLTQNDQKELYRMAYGIVCFSLLFSFVGTILGGIWADQSWGRFWGWDPKENGALMIVLWNAIILHARLSGIIRIRGFMLCAIFGNILTSFSWFGVNILGVGLHSYGFMDKAFFWLLLFIVTQFVAISLGLISKKYWKSELIK
jgi:ABC-type transport system involved in cytochrome c biogenesis permease subunit